MEAMHLENQMSQHTRTVAVITAWVAIGFAATVDRLWAADGEKPITYEDHVGSVLKKHCATCHGDAKQESGLNLANYSGVMKGSGGGAIVVAGRSTASRLVEVITATEEGERMPPDGDRVPAEAVALISTWIDTGLRETAGSSVAAKRTLGFKPAAPAADQGPNAVPGAVPGKLASIERPKTIRPYPVLAIAASTKAPVAAVAGYRVIDLYASPDTLYGSLPFPEGEPLVLRFSRSGRLLLAAGGKPVQSGSVVLFDVATGKRLASVADEPDAIIAADISPDEKRVAIGCTSRLVKLYSTEDGTLAATIEKHTDWVTAAAFSPDGKYLATGDRAGNIHLCDAASGGTVLQLAEHKAAVRALSWRSDSAVVASCGEDGTIVWWDVKDGWPVVNKPNAHPPARPAGTYGRIANGVLDAAFGPQGQLASCGRDGRVRLWADDGKEMKVFSIDDGVAGSGAAAPAAGAPGPQVLPTRVAISADGSTVLAGDTAGRLHAWPTR
jgi:WD40 repeat protein/mono/diheme cytochrome c family protein